MIANFPSNIADDKSYYITDVTFIILLICIWSLLCPFIKKKKTVLGFLLPE